MLLVTIGTASLSVYLYFIVPKGFFPQQDTGLLQGNLQSAPNLAFPIVSDRLTQFMKVIQADPAVDNVAGNVSGTRGYGQFNVQLKPLAERKVSADQIIARLRNKTQLPGASLFLQSPQDIRIGGRGSNSQFQYTLQGDTMEDLQKWANIMLDAIKVLPQVRDSNTDLQNRGLESKIVINRDTAARLGVTPQVIDNALGIRPAPGLDDVQTAESVPRRDGGGAALPAESGRAESDLCARVERAGSSVERVHSLRIRRYGAKHQSPGTVPFGDSVVQPGP
jgi:multidrug efflux pump